MKEVTVEMFPAHGGDCILVTFQAIEYRILIDGGFKVTFSDSLASELKRLDDAGKEINLLVVTHVDNDHIMGIIALFQKLDRQEIKIRIREIWYNGYRHLFSGKKQSLPSIQEKEVADEVRKIDVSADKDCLGKEIGYLQGETLSALLAGTWEEAWNKSFGGKAVSCQGRENPVELHQSCLYATILNPGFDELEVLEHGWNTFRRKKMLPMKNGDSVVYEDSFERFLTHVDSSVTNQSSIAFLLKYTDKTDRSYQLLFTGDAPAECWLKRLEGWKNIHLDCVKLPHHGSKGSVTLDHLKALHAEYVLFSTDGKMYNHPDWEVVSAVANSKNCHKIVFNYDCCMAVKQLEEEYPDKIVITGHEGYCKLKLE